jgi:hypothetical protein
VDEKQSRRNLFRRLFRFMIMVHGSVFHYKQTIINLFLMRQ